MLEHRLLMGECMITDMEKATREFKQQKAGAKQRGIAWELTFDQWREIWEESGRYMQRGTRRGQYGMQRFLDRGSYSAANVEIGTILQNVETRIRVKAFRRTSCKGTKSNIREESATQPTDQVLEHREAGHLQIVITPQMIEAGRRVILARFGENVTSADDLAASIFIAMIQSDG